MINAMMDIFDNYEPLPDTLGNFTKEAYDYLRVYDFSLHMSGMNQADRRKIVKAIVLESFMRVGYNKKVRTPTLFRIFDEIEKAQTELLSRQ